MNPMNETQLAAQLDKIVDRIQQLRRLDLSLEANLERALQESQDTLGALALYRKCLDRAAGYSRMMHATAA